MGRCQKREEMGSSFLGETLCPKIPRGFGSERSPQNGTGTSGKKKLEVAQKP
jgi:hypothetical protein